MLISKQKPLEEIMEYIEGEKKVFLVGCKGCAEGWESGGEREILEMKKKLEEKGKIVTGHVVVDMLCDKALSAIKLKNFKKKIDEADSLIVFTDGAGVQVVAELVKKMVHPGCNTISSGGAHAEWKGAERCMECGNCVLEYTGGLCPIARCSKHILNGPCGGSQYGKCEVDETIPCVWHLIYERLKEIGRLDKMEMFVAPKDWSLSLIAGPPVKRF